MILWICFFLRHFVLIDSVCRRVRSILSWRRNTGKCCTTGTPNILGRTGTDRDIWARPELRPLCSGTPRTPRPLLLTRRSSRMSRCRVQSPTVLQRWSSLFGSICKNKVNCGTSRDDSATALGAKMQRAESAIAPAHHVYSLCEWRIYFTTRPSLLV